MNNFQNMNRCQICESEGKTSILFRDAPTKYTIINVPREDFIKKGWRCSRSHTEEQMKNFNKNDYFN